jgi:hypothetical protein
MTEHRTRLRELPLITFYAILVFVEVASIVQAIRQHSWAPMFTTGWLPVVVLASLGPAGARRCGLRLGRRAQQ